MNKYEGSTIESLFEELGELEEVKTRAAKKILAIQVERRMKELGMSTTDLASRMRTSRNQVHRILDSEDAGITLKVLFRLAEALGSSLVVSLDPLRLNPISQESNGASELCAPRSTPKRRRSKPRTFVAA